MRTVFATVTGSNPVLTTKTVYFIIRKEMRKILKPRGDGKTTDLIHMSHETGAYIVCRSQETCSMISAMAREQNLDIPFPITYQEFLDGKYGMWISGFLIDDVDELLQRLSRAPIAAITMTT